MQLLAGNIIDREGDFQLAKKYYAVRSGRKTGVFENWNACKEQIHGYSGAVYKSFESYEDAHAFVEGQKKKNIEIDDPNTVRAYVDGSYFKEEGKYSYGCVIIHDGKEVRLKGVGTNEEYAAMRNVAGELLGAIEAVKWAHGNGHDSIIIYHDYEGIERWANGSWKANKEGTMEYVEFIKKYRKHIDIDFEKVAAHSGDFYNDEADRLAKQALIEDANAAAYEEKTPPRKIDVFNKVMDSADRTKNHINFTFKDYEISESKLKKFVKESWAMDGNDKDSIDIINLNVDVESSKIEWSVKDTSGKMHSFEMEI